MHSVMRILAAAALGTLALAGGAGGAELTGVVAGRRTIKAVDSPLLIPATVTVPKGASLTIEAGVTVKLGDGACLIVDGELHVLGEKRLPVRFEPVSDEVRWGNVKIRGDKDLPCYDGSRRYIEESGGSRILACEFIGGGKVVDEYYDGGALYLNGSAPIIRDCLFEGNQADRGGALVSYNFATPLIEGCTFENNESLLDDGGALYCFFYSDATIVRNFFVLNRSARHAGGLYISVSNPLVQENAFIDNSAVGWGGAIYVSSSSPRLLDNALYESTAEDRSTGIVFQADCRPEVRGNSLQSGGVEVFGLNLGADLDLSGNWWGTTDSFLIQGKIQQRGRGQERKLETAPWRDRPVENLLTQPVEIRSLHAMADREWADTLAFDLCDQALVRLQIQAVDRNKYAVDQTSAELRVLERPDPALTVFFVETEKASGIFRARVAINRREEDMPRLNVSVGQHVLISSTVNPEVKRLYRVDEARPVIHQLAILSDPDPTHAVQPALRLGWDYFSLLGDPQQAWHLQVATDSSFARPDMWDSGTRPLADGQRELTYEGSPLLDGERYFLRLRGQGGGSWSDWRRFMIRTDNALNTLRMNSLPPVPALLEPVPEALVTRPRPVLKAQGVKDREGDVVSYEFQMAADEFFQQVLAGSDPANCREAAWTVDRDLADNSAWWWRLRVLDGYESGDWSPAQRFHVNTLEEAPAPFDLVGPTGGIAELQPEFSWAEARDADPLSSLTYTLLVGKLETLQDAERVPGLVGLGHRMKQVLANREPLHWAVEAVDNSGRITRSRRVLRFVPDTTPSRPVALFPVNGEEVKAGGLFRFTPATDPSPADQLSYELQVVAEGGDFGKPQIDMRGLTQQDVAAASLDALPDSRLLAEDRPCSWRLRAVDNHGIASEWSETATCWLNRGNNPPTVPAELQPEEGTVLRLAPSLSWQAASDPDPGDPSATLTYVVQLSQEADFKGRLQEERVPGQTRLDLEGRIGDNARWYWRVQAMDDDLAVSGWTAVRSLIFNQVDEPPAGLAWLEPAEGASSASLDQISLSWLPATDPDWNARLTYHWRISPAEEPERVLAQGTTEEHRTLVKTPLASGREYLLSLGVTDDSGLGLQLPARRVRVDSHPTAPVLGMTGPELGPQDLLNWQASTDPDPTDRLKYRLALSSGSGTTLASTTVAETQALIGRLPGAAQLPEDQPLDWTVTALDNHGLEAVSATGRFWYNKVNQPPAAPAFAAELAGGVQRTDRPTLPFTPGLDPDHSDPPAVLWHELQVASNPDFRNAATHRVGAGEPAVSGIVLGDDARWHLRLRSVDNDGAAGPWSETLVQTVNLREDPPTAPQVREPAPGQRLYDLGGLALSWTPSTDPDPGARITYRVTLEDGQGRLLQRRESRESSLRLEQALSNDAEVILTVTAVDETGLESSSQSLRVVVDSRPGGVSISGRAGQVLGPGDALAWTEATDPDPADRLTYELAWSSSRAFADGGALSVDALRLSLERLGSLPENGEVWFRVRARDSHQLDGPWSDPWQGLWDAVNEPPLWQGVLGPPAGRRQPGELRVTWETPRDPDRRAQQLEVEMQAAGDEDFRTILWTRKADAATGFLSVQLKAGNRLWLRARAIDQGGAASAWSPVVFHEVDPPASSTP